MENRLAALLKSPDYQALIHQRHRIVLPLLFLAVGGYMSFVLFIAFAPASLGKPVIEGGVISVGILLGFFLILFNFVITLLYVRATNRHIEPLVKRIQGGVQ
jgi:uncharacterized membrane protein (DUF485 family)